MPFMGNETYGEYRIKYDNMYSRDKVRFQIVDTDSVVVHSFETSQRGAQAGLESAKRMIDDDFKMAVCEWCKRTGRPGQLYHSVTCKAPTETLVSFRKGETD